MSSTLVPGQMLQLFCLEWVAPTVSSTLTSIAAPSGSSNARKFEAVFRRRILRVAAARRELLSDMAAVSFAIPSHDAEGTRPGREIEVKSRGSLRHWASDFESMREGVILQAEEILLSAASPSAI